MPIVVFNEQITTVPMGSLISQLPLFQEIGMHCIGCVMASDETLEQACASHGVDPDEFLDYLTAYLETV